LTKKNKYSTKDKEGKQMAEQIKAVDGLITIPRAIRRGRAGLTAEQAIDVEKAGGRGGLLELFPGAAVRQHDMTQEELVAEMDKADVERGLLSIQVEGDKEWIAEALKKYPGKFVVGSPINPIEQGIMPEIRRVKSLMNEVSLQVIRVGGWRLGVPCTDNRLFPFYALAIENGLKVHINVGYPGPAGIARNQDPLFVDELCYLFPELTVIQTHGAVDPASTEIAVHNVIKYPNCYAMTNAYRPRYFPPQFIQHLNTRAQDKIIWATEYPLLTFQRSLDDVSQLPLRDHVRPKYLRENALRIFRFE
jgi:predicted TIM-barrel fold metal-dependent hydrolase